MKRLRFEEENHLVDEGCLIATFDLRVYTTYETINHGCVALFAHEGRKGFVHLPVPQTMGRSMWILQTPTGCQ